MREKLNAELSRMFAMLGNLDPKTEEYSIVLDNIGQVLFLVDHVTEEAEPSKDVPTPEQELVAKTEAMEEPLPGQVTVEEVMEEKAAPTREEVRAALLKLRDSGVKVGTILKQFIPEGATTAFSNVPIDKYADLMEAINHAG